MLSSHAAGNRVPRGDRLVVHETSTGGVEALRLTALTASYGNSSKFSFILSILWQKISPLGTLFLSVFVI